MDAFRTEGHRSDGARSGGLLRIVGDAGPLAGGYLAAEARREWTMRAVRPTVSRPAGGAAVAAIVLGRIWAALVAIGRRREGRPRPQPAVRSGAPIS